MGRPHRPTPEHPVYIFMHTQTHTHIYNQVITIQQTYHYHKSVSEAQTSEIALRVSSSKLPRASLYQMKTTTMMMIVTMVIIIMLLIMMMIMMKMIVIIMIMMLMMMMLKMVLIMLMVVMIMMMVVMMMMMMIVEIVIHMIYDYEQ